MKTQQKTPEPLPARYGYVIPLNVAVCPECGGRLYLTDDYDRTSPEPLPLDCEDEDWEDDDGVHRGWQSEWQPVIDKVRRHLNSHNAQDVPTASETRRLHNRPTSSRWHQRWFRLEQPKTMKTAHFEYKCRRCGAIDLNPHMGLPNGDGAATIKLVDAMAGRSDHPQSPRLLSLHSCGKDACGVSDLIGYHVTDD